VARGGAQTLTWMAMVAALFFVPAGLVVAELGAAFPNQGGPYVWARLAFGRRAGSLVALAYFLEPPVWVGGSLAITCVAVIDRLVLPLEGVWRVPVALAFVWTTVALAAAPLRAGKRVPLAGAATQVGLLVVFTATVAAYAAGHGVHAPAIGDLAPPGRCSPWSPPCWSTTSSASSCPRRPARSCATRPATFRRRSSAPACSPAPCTRCRCPAPLHRPPGRQRPFLPGRRRVLADLAPAGVQPPRRLLRPPRAGPGDRRRRPGRGRDHLPYPPGIPAIAPGELITTDLLEALRDEAHAGSRMAGASDPTLETVLVVRS